MEIENINVEETLKNAAKLIAEEEGLSPATKSLFEVLVLIITLLAKMVMRVELLRRSRPQTK